MLPSLVLFFFVTRSLSVVPVSSHITLHRARIEKKELSGVGVAGCGVYARASGAAWFGRRWGHLDLLLPLPDGAGEV